jgi:hypothetical protein
MTGSELATTLEERFGLPIRDKEIIERLDEYLDLMSSRDIGKNVAAYLKENVHWKAEQQPGDPPFSGEQAPGIAARHFSGLFAFQFGYSFGNMGAKAERCIWLADVSPGIKPEVYCQLASKLSECPVLASPGALPEAESLFNDVQDTVEEDPKKNERLAKQFSSSYPGVLPLMPQWFLKHGVKVPAQPPPCPSVGRPIVAYRAFLPIADILVRRAAGERAMLARTAAAECLTVATDSRYPPHVLLKLLSQALSGDPAAIETASQAQNHGGVKLTRIWAEKVLKREPPFQS